MKPYDYCVLLADALKSNTHVTEVSLIKCGITDVDVAVLAGVLAVNTTLEAVTEAALAKSASQTETSLEDTVIVAPTLSLLDRVND